MTYQIQIHRGQHMLMEYKRDMATVVALIKQTAESDRKAKLTKILIELDDGMTVTITPEPSSKANTK